MIVLTIVLTNGAVFSKNDFKLYAWALLGLIPFALYLVRNHAKSRGMLIGLHFVMALFAAIIPAGNPMIRILFMVVAVFYCMSSSFLCEERMQNQDIICPPIFTVIACSGCLMVLSQMNLEGWTYYYIIMMIILIYVYFVVYYLDNYVSFLKMNENSSGHIPRKNILVSGLKLLLGYLFIGLIILLATANSTWFHYILSPIKKVVVSLLRFLFSFVPEQDTEMEDMEVPEYLIELNETEMDVNRFANLIYTILAIVVVSIVVIGVVILIYKAITGFSHTEPVQETNYDVREKCEVVRKTKEEKKKWFASNSYEDRIRRIYKKKIRKSKELIGENLEETSLGLYTARECANRLEKPMIAKIYEKARYSENGCKKEDLSAMKEACK